MKILLICNAESVYVYNYIKNVLIPMGCDITVLATAESTMYKNFYCSKNIKIKEVKPINKYIAKLPKVRVIMQIVQDMKDIKSLGEFDYCHIHMYSFLFLLAACLTRKNTGKIVVSFWGSDLFTRNKTARIEKMLMNKVNIITLSTYAMADKFHELFGYNNDDKIVNVKFGLSVFETIDSFINKEESGLSKKTMSIPEDKFIVTCGCNGKPTQQHLETLEAIGRCPEYIKNKLFIVLPMSYGNDDIMYMNKVADQLNKSNIDGRILKQFLSRDEIAMLRLATDVFINVQKTDAFSGTMQEHLFAGSVVINGNWLDYRDLDEAGVKYVKIKNFLGLTEKITDIVDNYNNYHKDIIVNRGIIWNLSSWEQVRHKWQSLYTL